MDFPGFNVDQKLAVEGVWTKVAQSNGRPPSQFKLGLMNDVVNPVYAAVLDESVEKQKAFGDPTDKKASIKLVRDVFAKSIVTDWKDVPLDGVPAMAYSKDAVARLMDKYPLLYDHLVTKARDITRYFMKEEEKQKGN